jgi:hypothetical protein
VDINNIYVHYENNFTTSCIKSTYTGTQWKDNATLWGNVLFLNYAAKVDRKGYIDLKDVLH